MSNVIARSIFNTSTVERSWRTHITSGVVHAVVIAAAFLITFPAVRVLQTTPSEHVTLIAPAIPHYHPKIEAPRGRHLVKLVMPTPPAVMKPILPPVIPPPQPRTVAKVVPPPVAAAPKAVPAPRIVADLPPPPKPVIKTGSFQDAQLAKALPTTKQVNVGGFGDPRGVQSSETHNPSPVLMAKVGSFESPLGAGQTGGGGRMDSGAVKQSGFGNVGVPGGSANSRNVSDVRTGGFGDGVPGGTGHASNGSVRSTGFGDVVAATPQRSNTPSSVAAAFTPVEILFKPRPSYSAEAREMRLEGQISLEVVFQASGAVRVVRVIKGLGHGLDEAAQTAATQVRFKPATRSGAPVDTSATISITFELT